MNNSKNGIWQYAEEIQLDATSDNAGLTDTYTFVYDDDSLILKLPSVSTSINKASDDVYRLVVKWENNNLFFFPPFGVKWELFASWEDGRFLMKGNNKIKIFKKISINEIAAWNKELLKPERKMWEYDTAIQNMLL